MAGDGEVDGEMTGEVQGRIVATGLQFPEGPVWHERSVYVTEITGGAISRIDPAGAVERVATTGGGPNGAALGPDGDLWVTQNGGMPPGPRATPGIQRVVLDGAATPPVMLSITKVGKFALDAPNDLAFGPDGRLWLTDPRGGPDPGVNTKPGRIFAVDVMTGEGELIAELGPVFPNGIAFTADGTLLWTESFSRRVMRLRGSEPEVVLQLPERHAPDGMCIGADGRLYVAATYSHSVVVVDLGSDGAGTIVGKLMCGDGMPTNCCFGGTDLYVTESRRGTVWRFPLGVEGQPLF